MLVQRLRGYGFLLEAEEIFSATLAGAALARELGHRVLAPFLPAGALEDHGRTPRSWAASAAHRPRGATDVVVLGDLGERWTFALLQEAFEH